MQLKSNNTLLMAIENVVNANSINNPLQTFKPYHLLMLTVETFNINDCIPIILSYHHFYFKTI